MSTTTAHQSQPIPTLLFQHDSTFNDIFTNMDSADDTAIDFADSYDPPITIHTPHLGTPNSTDEWGATLSAKTNHTTPHNLTNTATFSQQSPPIPSMGANNLSGSSPVKKEEVTVGIIIPTGELPETHRRPTGA
jgi:hypothetical protein